MRTIALLLLVATLASCKEYVCDCDMQSTSGYAGFTTSENFGANTIKTTSKKKAKAFCKKVEANQLASGKTGTCTLQ